MVVLTTYVKLTAATRRGARFLTGKMSPEARHRGSQKPPVCVAAAAPGFPTGLKWSFMPKDYDGQKYLVVNSDEIRARHLPRPRNTALQPAQRSLKAWRSRRMRWVRPLRTTICAVSSWTSHFRVSRQAVKEAYEAGLLGKNVQGSGIDIDIHGFIGAGAYICGEETALIESLEGKQGRPRFKPPFPANFGLYGKPTTINNTQSIASVPTIIRKGGDLVCGPRSGRFRRHGPVLRFGTCREARQLRVADGHSVQGRCSKKSAVVCGRGASSKP